MEKSFEDELEGLKEAWLSEEGENEPPDELGNAVMDFILRSERLRHRVLPGTPEADAIDRRTRASLHQPDTLDPAHSLFEGFIRRLSRDPESAIKYITKFIADRSAARSKIARKPRPKRRDKIMLTIYDCLEGDLSLSAKAVGAYLRNDPNIKLNAGVYRHEHDSSTMREELLASRVSWAKKTLRKNSDYHR